MAKYYKLGGIEHRLLLSYSSKGEKSEVEVSQSWFLLKAMRKNPFHAFFLVFWGLSGNLCIP